MAAKPAAGTRASEKASHKRGAVDQGRMLIDVSLIERCPKTGFHFTILRRKLPTCRGEGTAKPLVPEENVSRRAGPRPC